MISTIGIHRILSPYSQDSCAGCAQPHTGKRHTFPGSDAEFCTRCHREIQHEREKSYRERVREEERNDEVRVCRRCREPFVTFVSSTTQSCENCLNVARKERATQYHMALEVEVPACACGCGEAAQHYGRGKFASIACYQRVYHRAERKAAG